MYISKNKYICGQMALTAKKTRINHDVGKYLFAEALTSGQMPDMAG